MGTKILIWLHNNTPDLVRKTSDHQTSVSEIWKVANVTPMFKKGCKGDPGNYRPISLTCMHCKVMESVIRDSMVDFLLTNNLMC